MATSKWKLVSEENLEAVFKATGRSDEEFAKLKAIRGTNDVFETFCRDGNTITWTTDEWGTTITRKVKIGEWTEVDGPPGMPKGKMLVESESENDSKFQMVAGPMKASGTRKINGNEMIVTLNTNGVIGRRVFTRV